MNALVATGTFTAAVPAISVPEPPGRSPPSSLASWSGCSLCFLLCVAVPFTVHVVCDYRVCFTYPFRLKLVQISRYAQRAFDIGLAYTRRKHHRYGQRQCAAVRLPVRRCRLRCEYIGFLRTDGDMSSLSDSASNRATDLTISASPRPLSSQPSTSTLTRLQCVVFHVSSLKARITAAAPSSAHTAIVRCTSRMIMDSPDRDIVPTIANCPS